MSVQIIKHSHALGRNKDVSRWFEGFIECTHAGSLNPVNIFCAAYQALCLMGGIYISIAKYTCLNPYPWRITSAHKDGNQSLAIEVWGGAIGPLNGHNMHQCHIEGQHIIPVVRLSKWHWDQVFLWLESKRVFLDIRQIAVDLRAGIEQHIERLVGNLVLLIGPVRRGIWLEDSGLACKGQAACKKENSCACDRADAIHGFGSRDQSSAWSITP